MKKVLATAFVAFLLINSLGAQNNLNLTKEIRMPLIGDSAPSFTVQSTLGTIHFPADYFGKWKVLFSHPADFTPVCSSEIISLATMQEDFKDLNTQLIVLSTDGINSHISWVKSLETINADGIPNFKIMFPLVSDHNLEISRKYGMVHPGSSTTRTVRAVFIINPENVISAIFYYPENVGRNMEEIMRTLRALKTSEKHTVLIPVNWYPGDKVMIPSPGTVEDAEKLAASKNKNLYSPIWYMWYKSL